MGVRSLSHWATREAPFVISDTHGSPLEAGGYPEALSQGPELQMLTHIYLSSTPDA